MTHTAGWEKLDAATTTRKELLKAGFRPVPAIGKAVPLQGWSDIAATDRIIDDWARLFPDAHNTGVLTRDVPALDIDITDTAAADAVEALAREHFEERGWFLVRFGKSPKRCIPLRTDAPFKKLKLALAAPNGGADCAAAVAALVKSRIRPASRRYPVVTSSAPGSSRRHTAASRGWRAAGS